MSSGFSSKVSFLINAPIHPLTLRKDEYMKLWYYDRQSPIHTSSINFLQNPCYFLALLFIFQRFSTDDWGKLPELQRVGVDEPYMWQLALSNTTPGGKL
jgi:hypothetical protein